MTAAGGQHRVHLRHRGAGLAQQGQGLDHPEPAGQEGSLLRLHAGAAVDERSATQFAANGVARRRQPIGAWKAEPGGEQQRCIEPFGARMHRVGLLGLGPAIRVNPIADAIAFAPPAIDMAGVDLSLLSQSHRPRQRGPAAELGHGVVFRLLQLPHSGVTAAPKVGAAIGQLGQQAPGHEVEHMAPLEEQRRCLQQVAIGAELELRAGAVAGSHGATATIARQVQLGFFRRQPAVQAVHHADLAAMAAHRRGQPGERRLGLLGRSHPQERLDGVGHVAHPGVAVVVVLVAADALRQRGRGRCGNGAGGREQQQLQRQRAAPHRPRIGPAHREVAAPLPPGLIAAIDPRVDGGDRRQDQRLVRRRQHRHHSPGAGLRDQPGQHAVIGLARAHDGVVGAKGRDQAVDMQHVAMRAWLAPGIRVIEPPADQDRDVELDRAFQPLDPARQFTPGQTAGNAAVERVGDLGAPGGGGEHLLQHIAVGTVGALDSEGLVGRDREASADHRIEQPVEQRGAVDVRHAPPVNGAIRTHQRHAAAVAKGGIFGERQLPRDPLAQAQGRWLPPVAP